MRKLIHLCCITGDEWKHLFLCRQNFQVDPTLAAGDRPPSAGPGAPRALGDGAARTAAAGRMLTRRDMSFTAVMLASAWDG